MLQKFLLFFLLTFTLNVCANQNQVKDSSTNQNPLVLITTNQGNIELELNREKAPKTVANFLQYAKDGFYSGTVFHRVIKGFMIQGGGFTTDLNRKQGRPPIDNEAFNGLKNNKGTIAMARTNQPHSASAQFFINTVQNDFLNFRNKSMRGWGYAVFGKVTKGMDVVQKIENTRTGARGVFNQDVPQEDIIIEKVEIIKE